MLQILRLFAESKACLDALVYLLRLRVTHTFACISIKMNNIPSLTNDPCLSSPRLRIYSSAGT